MWTSTNDGVGVADEADAVADAEVAVFVQRPQSVVDARPSTETERQGMGEM